ncbi:hypothetical protein SRABI96_03780 [Peribacillus sp. Bi96]|nr:hypothetical protein SRABI96_03780 [Peribacillus sp. Bi96]
MKSELEFIGSYSFCWALFVSEIYLLHAIAFERRQLVGKLNIIGDNN